ncbi:uncharacterized protein LOC122073891 isoform X1 [Macadamia integrifolia]|uniref:uncharacterized protein LOC122073891 isoform X1 n=1 Tax=Macadamia integrifolia TaxID=60698 RepID=UPI001C4F9FEC|nr:uncharacterized protein LOC122073891 isoform X1 [Macadamia integrifolia]
MNQSTMASQESQTISLKVLMDKENNKVVMVEADSDFVDILFSFLTMPMGTIVRLISNQPEPDIIGSITTLYKQVEKLQEQFLQTPDFKSMLLDPRNNRSETQCRRLELNINDTKPKYYICSNWNSCRRSYNSQYSTCKNVRCNCGNMMDKEICFEIEDGGVFVCGMTKFMVTDDLQVEPMSPATSLTLLHKLGIKDMSSLQETTLSIGSEEALRLLKVSLFSKSVFTDALLVNFGLKSPKQEK